MLKAQELVMGIKHGVAEQGRESIRCSSAHECCESAVHLAAALEHGGCSYPAV